MQFAQHLERRTIRQPALGHHVIKLVVRQNRDRPSPCRLQIDSFDSSPFALARFDSCTSDPCACIVQAAVPPSSSGRLYVSNVASPPDSGAIETCTRRRTPSGKNIACWIARFASPCRPGPNTSSAAASPCSMYAAAGVTADLAPGDRPDTRATAHSTAFRTACSSKRSTATCPSKRVSLLCAARRPSGERRAAVPRTTQRRIEREPMPRPLERIIRQQQPLPLPRLIPAAPIDAPAADVILANTAGDHLPIILPFAQRRQPGRRQAPARSAVPCRASWPSARFR